jgi:hypothetical protein
LYPLEPSWTRPSRLKTMRYVAIPTIGITMASLEKPKVFVVDHNDCLALVFL